MKTFATKLIAVMAIVVPILAVADSSSVKIVGIAELSGNGATVGTNFDNGIKLAVKEINATGGILGRKIEYTAWDSQTNSGVAKAMASKAVDDDTYVVIGPVYSGSVLVSMAETRRAEIPNFTGAEAPLITEQGNPYIFRTSISLSAVFSKLAGYVKNSLKAQTAVILYGNNDAGKGARDAAAKSLTALGVKLMPDISTDPGQVDFTSAVLLAKKSGADALIVYVNEEEAARLLKTLKQIGYDKPVVGANTLTSPSVLRLAGESANGAIAVVDMAYGAPQETVKAYHQKFESAYKYKSDHNAMKGYSAMYVIKAMTEKLKKFDRKELAKAMHGATISAKEYPGVLLDLTYDAKGDLDRESFLVQVKNGEQVVIGSLPAGSSK